jgi:hypothetical protein
MDYGAAFFLTVKNTRKFIRSTRSKSGDSFMISTGEIGTDEKFADANFSFLIVPYWFNSPQLCCGIRGK